MKQSALQVNEGVEQPPIVNPNASSRYKKMKQKQLTTNEFVEGILSHNIAILSKAITMVESSLPKHNACGQEINAAT